MIEPDIRPDEVPILDPEDLDATRPDDYDACPTCDGQGGVTIGPRDPFTGYQDGEQCGDCHGTGTVRL